MDGLMGGWVDGDIDGWINRQMGWKDGGQVDEWTDGGQVDEWTDAQVTRWINLQVAEAGVHFTKNVSNHSSMMMNHISFTKQLGLTCSDERKALWISKITR